MKTPITAFCFVIFVGSAVFAAQANRATFADMDWRGLSRWVGLSIMLTAALLSNIAVEKMAQVVNSSRSGRGKVSWEFKGDKANREVIRVYRENNPNGPLFRNFLLACSLFVVGVVIMFSQDLLSNIGLAGR